jgi:ferric-dicitrate binding protein FerR (iron transport regulator)
MTQEYLKKLAQKFLDGTATEEEKRLLNEWYDKKNTDESNPEIILVSEEVSADDVKNRTLDRLKSWQENQTNSDKPKFTIIRRLATWSSAVAAATLIGFLIYTNKISHQAPETTTISAPFGKTLKVALPDGSAVWLNAGSTISFKSDFSGKTREIILKEGQAFFDVVHQTQRPFVVHAKTLDVTVLGTSFDVKAYNNDPEIKVTVKTGKVGVTLREKPERPALFLLPKEQAVLQPKKAEIEVNKISQPAIAPWKDNKLIFEDEFLPAVFHVLERQYNQHILVEKEALASEKISLTLDNQPLADVLKVLSFSKKFNYSQLNDSTIVIR